MSFVRLIKANSLKYQDFLIYWLVGLITLVSCQDNRKIKDVKNKAIQPELIDSNQELSINEDVKDSIWIAQLLQDYPYDYDTLLSDDYHLHHKIFKIDDDYLQSLTLMYFDEVIKEFEPYSYQLPDKNIGYVGADFDESFVMVHSFGGGNPHWIFLIDKETGMELKKGTWVDANENEQVLLYLNSLESDSIDTKGLFLYDIKNNKEIPIIAFNNSKCAQNTPEGIRECVEIDTVNSEYIVLKVQSFDETIIKTYER